ncbi:MAG: winged helix-turn-helix domain-containing tetratricopeptide repeat protein [Candidatus Sulfotelmatobacter sp.]
MKNSETVPTNELPVPASDSYRFGQFVLDPRRRALSRAGSPVFLTPKAFDVLKFLVQNPNRLVTKEELLQAVWGDTFVEEGNLTQYISHLRKALGDNSEDTRLIVTIARKGYQFTGNVGAIAEAGDISKPTPVRIPATESRQSDMPPVLDFRAKEAVPKAQKLWQRAAGVAASAAILLGAGYTSWRHFQVAGPPRSTKVMLAVLPFENLTGDPNKEYLADGLTEETISQLGQLNPEELGVIARTSVMGYKHKDERLDQVGRDLSVQYVLEDSLRESGDHMRLTAQLIQVKDQTHLWAQDYDYPVKDVLNVEDDVAKAVAHEIRVRLTSKKQVELAQSHPVNPEAFDAYLQGYYFFERNTNKDTDMAAKYYERATQLDPSYALAWAGLSRVRKWQASAGLVPAEEGYRLAREEVERALALNPNLAAAHAQMGRIKQQVDFDWAGADASFQRAIALDHGDPANVRAAASSAAMLGRLDEGLRLARQAVDLDPLNASSWESLGEKEFWMGQLDEAARDSKKALELSPDVFPGPVQLSQIYVLQGRPQDALLEIKLVRYDPERAFLYPITYYALGRKKESDAALTKLITKYHASMAYEIAKVYAFRNQSNEAFEWLDRAYAQRDSGLIGTKVDPLLKSLHNDPRYAAFLKKINLPDLRNGPPSRSDSIVNSTAVLERFKSTFVDFWLLDPVVER